MTYQSTNRPVSIFASLRMAGSKYLVSHPLEDNACELSGVTLESWATVRGDNRKFEKALHDLRSGVSGSHIDHGHTIDAEPMMDADEGTPLTPLSFNPAQPMLLTGIQPADPARELIVSALEDGFEEMTGAILDSITNHQNTLAGLRQEQALKSCWHILLSKDARVLRTLLEGNLVERNANEKDTRTALTRIRSRARKAKQPCIYGNFFTAKDGSLQTVTEINRTLAAMERYADTIRFRTEQEHNVAFKIDTVVNLFHPNARKWDYGFNEKGYRRYLAKLPSTSQPLSVYTHTLARFISSVQHRLDE